MSYYLNTAGFSMVHHLNKLTMTKDAFVYAINQSYEARKKNDTHFNSHLRFEPFLEKNWMLPEKVDFNQFKKNLTEIITHHFSAVPNYKREENVTLENISWFSHSFAVLFADVECLLKSYTGHGFPLLSTPQLPRANSSKTIARAIKKYAEYRALPENEEKFSLFPLEEGDSAAADEAYTQEVWSLFLYLTKKVFGPYGDLMGEYITWKYVIPSQSSETVDWNVRPPCGSAYKKQFKHLFERDFKNKFKKNDKNGKKEDTASKGVAPKFIPSSASIAEGPEEFVVSPEGRPFLRPQASFEEGTNTEHSETPAPRPPRDHAARPARDNAPRPARDQEAPRPPRSEKGPNSRHPKRQFQNEVPQSQDDAIEKALEEVAFALAQLKKNTKLNEFALHPQNSFLRRQQHVVILEAGFDTESRGEAETRHVCIIKK